MKLEYTFRRQGYTLSKHEKDAVSKQEIIYLDVGGVLGPNCYDHHQISIENMNSHPQYKSNASLVYHMPEYLPSSDGNEYTICTHDNPDFDALASIYLAEYFVRNGKFPKYADKLVEYTNAIDSGELCINQDSLTQPLTIVYLMDKTIEEEIIKEYSAQFPIRETESYRYEFNLRKTQRGLQLIGYVLGSLDALPKVLRNFESSGVINKNSPFKREIEFAESDYQLYIEDCESSKTSISEIELFNHDTGVTDNVDVFVWNDIPSCHLHKHWARSDKRSKTGNGYNVTFIPVEKTHYNLSNKEVYLISKHLDDIACDSYHIIGETYKAFIEKMYDRNILESGYSDALDSLRACVISKFESIINDTLSPDAHNRVIISIKPDVPYNLSGLAEDLERAEKFKEVAVYGNRSPFNRSFISENMTECGGKTFPRFNELWCNNHDPWYDGRHANYKIVDTPKRGTLLTHDEVFRTFMNHSKPTVIDSTCDIMIPYYFGNDFTSSNESFNQLTRELDKCQWIQQQSILDSYDDFGEYLPYIKSYLSKTATSDNKSKGHCYYGKLNTSHEIVRSLISCGLSNIDNHTVLDASMMVFRYGIGYIRIKIKTFDKNDMDKLTIDQLIDYNGSLAKRFFEGVSEIIDMLKLISKDEVKQHEPFLYQFVAVDKKRFYDNQKYACVYMLTNQLQRNRSNGERYFAGILSDKIALKVSENVIYGFGKQGGCLICTASDKNIKEVETLNYYENRFQNVDFLTLMLSLHQRHALMHFSDKLSTCANRRRNGRLISLLRYDLMDFMSQGWFCQVNKTEIGNRIYKKWDIIFENDDLYNEVSEQLETIDEYKKAEFSNKVSWFTSLFVPLVIVDSVFSSHILKSENQFIIEPWTTMVLVLVLMIVFTIGMTRDRTFRSRIRRKFRQK